MALYQGYTSGNINIDVSGGDGVSENGFTMKGDIEMDGNEVKGLGAPTGDTSAVTKKWVDNEIVKQAAVSINPAGFTMTGDINMGNNKITGLNSNGSDFSEASSVQYVHTYTWNNYLASNGFNKMKGILNAGGFEIQGLPTTASKADSAVSGFRMAEWTGGKYLPLDGAKSMTNNLNMNNNEIVALGDPTTGKSAVHKDWVLNRPVTKDLDMKNHEIKNVGDPTDDKSAVNKKWVNDKISGGRSRRETYSGLILSDDIDMNNNEIIKLGSPTTDNSAVSKKWVTDHVSGSSINTSGFTMTGNIDMGGFSVTGLKSGSVGNTAALSSNTIDTWGLQFLKRNGGTLASNLNVNNYELTGIGNPTTDKSAVNKKWVNDNFMSSSGLVQGDLDMGDSSRIVDLRDPVNDQDAVNKRWVVAGFEPKVASGKYVETKHHIYTDWVWGYRNITVATTYHPYCHDQIPPMWRTETISSLANINLQTVTMKHTANRLSDATNVNIELLLRAVYFVLGSNGRYTQTKKDFILGTLDLSKASHCYFLGTRQSDGASGACWAFKVNTEYYLGNISELVDNTLAWCVVIKAEQALPAGKSMDLAFQWQLIYAGSRGG